MKVVTTLYESNARQIPQMLRKLADDIESKPGAQAQRKLLSITDGGELWPIPVGGSAPKA